MIKVRLSCASAVKTSLMQALESRGIAVSDEAEVSIVERGMALPETGTCILFDGGSPDALLAFLSELYPTQTAKRINLITGKKNDAFHPLKVERIMYFEAEGNNVYCLAENVRYEVQEKLYELEARLQSRAFVRIHKSFIVNVNWIEEILPRFGGRLLLRFKGSGAGVGALIGLAARFAFQFFYHSLGGNKALGFIAIAAVIGAGTFAGAFSLGVRQATYLFILVLMAELSGVTMAAIGYVRYLKMNERLRAIQKASEDQAENGERAGG